MPKKVSQSGFGSVIMCHFALSSIWGSPKHPRITNNHQISGEFHQSFGDFTQISPKFTNILVILGAFLPLLGWFWSAKKVSQSGFGPVIVCHFALSSIWGSPKHTRITKNHQTSGEFHKSFGDFHPNFIKFHQCFGDFGCLFTPFGVVLECQKRYPKVVLDQ